MDDITLQDAADKAMTLICKWEGFSDTSYKCPKGVLTIGWGRTNSVNGRGPVKIGEKTTMAAEEVWLRERIKKDIQWIDKQLDYHLNANQLAALCSLVYNIGREAFRVSNVRKNLNNGRNDVAIEYWKQWNKVNAKVFKGLVQRRAEEIEVFQGLR